MKNDSHWGSLNGKDFVHISGDPQEMPKNNLLQELITYW